MKDFLRRVVHGIAYGIGIAIVAGVAVLVANWMSERHAKPAKIVASAIKVTEARDATTSMGRAVVGVATNVGPQESTGREIAVDFYDKDGRLVDTCSDYLPSGIPRSGSAPFKISCDDPDAPIRLPHISFKVRLGPVPDDGGP